MACYLDVNHKVKRLFMLKTQVTGAIAYSQSRSALWRDRDSLTVLLFAEVYGSKAISFAHYGYEMSRLKS